MVDTYDVRASFLVAAGRCFCSCSWLSIFVVVVVVVIASISSLLFVKKKKKSILANALSAAETCSRKI